MFPYILSKNLLISKPKSKSFFKKAGWTWWFLYKCFCVYVNPLICTPPPQVWWLWNYRTWRKDGLQSTPGSKRDCGSTSTGQRAGRHNSCPAVLGRRTSYQPEHQNCFTVFCLHESWYCLTVTQLQDDYSSVVIQTIKLPFKWSF